MWHMFKSLYTAAFSRSWELQLTNMAAIPLNNLVWQCKIYASLIVKLSIARTDQFVYKHRFAESVSQKAACYPITWEYHFGS